MAEEEYDKEKKETLIENQERQSNIKWIMNYIEHINKEVLPHIDMKDARRRLARSIIFNDKELINRIPKLQIYIQIYNIHDEHKKDSLAFINKVKEVEHLIKIVDVELASKIESIYFNRDVVNYLKNRYSELEKINDIHVFLRELYPKLYREFSSLENKKLFNELDRLFSKKIEEKNYLGRYSREVISWNNFPEPKRIEYYAQRIRFFLYGGYEDYKGLIKDFKDEDIAHEMKKKNVVKQLLNYSMERKFIADRITEVRAGWQEGNWGDFYKFFKNAKKYADDLIARFGNVDFASRIIKDKKKFRENPKEWLMALQEMEAQLANRHYFEKNVLKPAIKELVDVFDRQAEKRKQELDKSLKEFKDYMNKVLKEIEAGPKKKAKEIINYVRSRETKIMNEWRKIRNEFEKYENPLIQNMVVIDNLLRELNEKSTDPQMYLKKIDGIEERQEQWRRYFIKMINNIDVMKTGNMHFAAEMLSLVPIMGSHDKIIKKNDEKLEEEMITNFSKNIPKIMKVAEKANEQLDKINELILERGLTNILQRNPAKIISKESFVKRIPGGRNLKVA